MAAPNDGTKINKANQFVLVMDSHFVEFTSKTFPLSLGSDYLF